uniref:Uncharacterized protein n=1 Tax=Eptatretus burgeri TaxID=7764 RepID=A0A8C4QDQ6_EPTBU
MFTQIIMCVNLVIVVLVKLKVLSCRTGYAVAAGHFPHPNGKVVAAGAPRINGTVILLSLEDGSLKKYQEILGTQLGAYFGAVLCLMDLNSDGMDDLLVGAPQYTEIRDEGRVYVYISNAGKMQETTQLAGSHAYNAHFGTAIESLGDINDDGFQDVAIGAPQEDDFHGVVYIYQGDDGGIVPHYSQKIFGRKISTRLKMFGQSISGGKDMDGNGYNDLTVGSFADAVVLLRSREIQIISATVHLPSFTKRIPQACVENGVSMICLNMTVCFKKLKGTGTTVLEYTLQENVDTNHQPRLGFPGQPKVVRCLVNRLVLRDGSSSCRRHMGIVQVRLYVGSKI